jgi:hypothetical protein
VILLDDPNTRGALEPKPEPGGFRFKKVPPVLEDEDEA